jgi:polysaccharide export outer membrane protein
MNRTNIAIVLLVALLLFASGCGDKFYDPTQIGRFRPVPAVNVILDSLGVAEETKSAWEGAEDPRPIDVIAYEKDYVFGPGDFIRITIFELYAEGVPLVSEYVVTETGKVSIPDVGVIEAAGLTEAELEEQIKQILSPGILKEPSVSVILTSSQQRTFTILGNAVPRPGRYAIPRYNYRLNDAIAEAQVATQYNVTNIYVTRAVTGQEDLTEPVVAEITDVSTTVFPEATEPGEMKSMELKIPKEQDVEPEKKYIIPEDNMLEIIAPHAQDSFNNDSLLITTSEMVTNLELAEMALPEELLITEDQQIQNDNINFTNVEILADEEKNIEPPLQNNVGRIEWIFQDGRWVPVQIGRPQEKEAVAKEDFEIKKEPLRQKLPESFDWDQIETGGVQSRVIKIPTDKLAGGDPRYNIAIRPGDTIHVPVDVIGECFIYGNTNLQGAIPLTGRPLTLKMAIAAAGGLGPLAWPKRCEVTRRIARNKEETVMINLDKIASGEQPDFFIKPLDLINVGTHPTSRWRAVLRNAFRATYGFGFIYDRNFADRDFLTSRPIPSFLTNLF